MVDTCLLFRETSEQKVLAYLIPVLIWECCCLHTLLGPDGSGCLLLLSTLRGVFQQQQPVSDISLPPPSSILVRVTRCF